MFTGLPFFTNIQVKDLTMDSPIPAPIKNELALKIAERVLIFGDPCYCDSCCGVEVAESVELERDCGD